MLQRILMHLLLLLELALKRAIEIVFEQDARICCVLHRVANLSMHFSRLKVLVSRVAEYDTLLNTDLANTI